MLSKADQEWQGFTLARLGLYMDTSFSDIDNSESEGLIRWIETWAGADRDTLRNAIVMLAVLGVIDDVALRNIDILVFGAKEVARQEQVWRDSNAG